MINDAACVEFLQWCLPRLGLRWPGFRKVRRHVHKRINRRLAELGLPDLSAYRAYLERHPAEWQALDTMCWIGISRFYRDRGVFQFLEHDVLPQLAQLALARGDEEIRCWCAGCAGGQEPYTLAIIWKQNLAPRFPELRLRIVATDIDSSAIRRAERACYRPSGIKDLPPEWRNLAFVAAADELCLKDEYRGSVEFLVQDIRVRAPEGPFHLILCRNLVFTYFDESLQRQTTARLVARLAPAGGLIIGNLESLPDGPWAIQPWSKRFGVYRKVAGEPEETKEAPPRPMATSCRFRPRDPQKSRALANRLLCLRASFFFCQPHLAGGNFTQRGYDFSIIGFKKRLGALEQPLGSFCCDYRQLETIGNFFETVLYSDPRHKIPPMPGALDFLLYPSATSLVPALNKWNTCLAPAPGKISACGPTPEP